MSATPILLLAAALAAGPPPNQLTNPDFDTDLSGWSELLGAQWDPLDVDGAPTSGSVRVLNQEPPFSLAGFAQCLPVVPGGTYMLRAAGLYPSGQPGGVNVHAEVFRNWWDGPACTDASASGVGGSLEVPQNGLWQVLDFGPMVAPPWASSVEVGGYVSRDDMTVEPEAHFDAFVLTGPRAIFTDTFESGAVAGWDQVVP